MAGGVVGAVGGEHRVDRKTLWWLHGAAAALFSVGAVFNLFYGRAVLGGINAVAAALALSALLTSRSERTVVGPDGIRVKRGFRWCAVRWDDVEHVAEPNQWTWDRTLRVTTTAGEDVRTRRSWCVPRRVHRVRPGRRASMRTSRRAAPRHRVMSTVLKGAHGRRGMPCHH